ncbi:fasciclin domain-containing protein [Streptomyces sp. OfavH-34-F]|uniref:fasciclin domain-containing protein n=1 Tax=Streptomyces sp. OfavH-34-F TaxID=2917760 RepID=UPI001EF27D49|nr:fasciclin domain-containing protein [Streptomyces sp. OfavH-34-F]MCG7524118.1 fasciclin domain-containing protein [Streptomyces sp. OfavH-34-F]
MKVIHARRAAVALSAALVLPLALSACSGESDSSASGASGTSAKASAAPSSATPVNTDEPFGPACASVPKRGAGSFTGMAQDPVATAASNNPALSTLVTAVGKAGLVDTLNSARNITVFAPTNDAFAKVPKADLEKLLADKEALTKVLTYHVVGRKLTPQQLAKGSFETLEKGELTTAGAGGAYTVNGTSQIVCGNVPTANATVYIVDTVLMPPAA